MRVAFVGSTLLEPVQRHIVNLLAELGGTEVDVAKADYLVAYGDGVDCKTAGDVAAAELGLTGDLAKAWDESKAGIKHSVSLKTLEAEVALASSIIDELVSQPAPVADVAPAVVEGVVEVDAAETRKRKK